MKANRNIPQSILYICILLVNLLMLAMDGKAQGIKPEQIRRVESPFADTLIKRVRAIYTSQIGVREKQANSGPEVEAYLRYVNLPKGNPWCAAFVCWTLGKAGVGNPRTGWSPSLFPGNKVILEGGQLKGENGKLKAAKVEPGTPPVARPRSADVFGLYFPEKNRIAHVGFIDEWNDSWVTTVEGNTNVLGSREGDGVYRKRRLVRSVYQVARYAD